jgi:hypothetical protein
MSPKQADNLVDQMQRAAASQQTGLSQVRPGATITTPQAVAIEQSRIAADVQRHAAAFKEYTALASRNNLTGDELRRRTFLYGQMDAIVRDIARREEALGRTTRIKFPKPSKPRTSKKRLDKASMPEVETQTYPESVSTQAATSPSARQEAGTYKPDSQVEDTDDTTSKPARSEAGNLGSITFKMHGGRSTTIRKYDPDQRRDDHGRFADEGKGGAGSSAGPAAHRQLGTVATGLGAISGRADAVASIKSARAVHDRMKQLPATAWRDPTSLDHAWNGYLTTVASVAALAAIGVALGATTSAGVMLAGAHVHPLHSALGAGMMAAFPKFWSTFSYTTARRYLTTLFPSESKALRPALSILPMVGAGTAGVGAVLATALALRYAYREIETNGEYKGVSSVNRRIELLDQHINSLTAAMSGGSVPSDTNPQQRRILPFIQAGMAVAASLAALTGAGKLGMMAYRAAQRPRLSLGPTEGLGRDLASLFRGAGSDLGRVGRGALKPLFGARSPATG